MIWLGRAVIGCGPGTGDSAEDAPDLTGVVECRGLAFAEVGI